MWLIIFLITGIAVIVIAGIMLSLQFGRSDNPTVSNLSAFAVTGWALGLMTIGVIIVLGFLALFFLDEVIGLSEILSIVLTGIFSAVAIVPGIAVAKGFEKKKIEKCKMDPTCEL